MKFRSARIDLHDKAFDCPSPAQIAGVRIVERLNALDRRVDRVIPLYARKSWDWPGGRLRVALSVVEGLIVIALVVHFAIG